MDQLLNKRSNTLDIVKGFAILNIIFIHTVFWSGQVYFSNEIIRQASLFVDVPLFFFLSGWASSMHNNNYLTIIKRQIKLYIPYIMIVFFLILSLTFFYHKNLSIDVIFGWLTVNATA